MSIEDLDKIKFLFSKLTDVNQENNSYKQDAHFELLVILKSIVEDDKKRREMFNWFKSEQEKDKKFMGFLKQEIQRINLKMLDNLMTKDDLLLAIDNAVESENKGEGNEGYESLMECVESFVDASDFSTLDFILNDLTLKSINPNNLEKILDKQRAEILTEILYYVIGNIYSSDIEDGYNCIKGSTLFCIPIVLKAKKSIVQTPDINVLSQVIKENLVKRKVIKDHKNIEIGTSLYNIKNMKAISCETIWSLHNSLLLDYETDSNNALRSNIQKHNGEISLIFCFLNVLSCTVIDKEGARDRLNILNAVTSSFTDFDLWKDISNDMENINTIYNVYPPKELLEIINNLDSYEDMTSFRMIFSRREKDFDLLYMNISKSNDLMLIFVDKDTGILSFSYLLETNFRGSDVLLEIESLCKKNDVLLYKYKYPLNALQLDKLKKVLNNEKNPDGLKYMKNSVLVDREWMSWLNIDKILSSNSLH